MDINDLFITDDDDDDDFIENEEDIINSFIQQQSMPEIIWGCTSAPEFKEVSELGEKHIYEKITQELINNNISSLKKIIIFDTNAKSYSDIYAKYTNEIGAEVTDLETLKGCDGLIKAAYDKNCLQQIMFLSYNTVLWYALSIDLDLWPNNIPEDTLITNANFAPFEVLHELGHVFCHDKILAPNNLLNDQIKKNIQLNDDEEKEIQSYSLSCFNEYFASRFACSNLEQNQDEYYYYDPKRMSAFALQVVKKEYSFNGNMSALPNKLFSYIACCHHYNIDVNWGTIKSIPNLNEYYIGMLEDAVNTCHDLYNVYQNSPEEFNKALHSNIRFMESWYNALTQPDEEPYEDIDEIYCRNNPNM